jgi:cytochrome c556
MKKPLLTAATAVLLSTTTLAFADAEDAIEYRQSVFKAIKYHFGPMADMVRGKTDYDQAAFSLHADRVAALAKMPGDGFIEGSDKGADTEAKASIWSNRADFDQRLENFASDAETLAKIAGTGDMDQIRDALGNVGKNCKACHDEYKD